jgi:hypothetical protein
MVIVGRNLLTPLRAPRRGGPGARAAWSVSYAHDVPKHSGQSLGIGWVEAPAYPDLSMTRRRAAVVAVRSGLVDEMLGHEPDLQLVSA